MHIVTRRSALGVLISPLPARNPPGKDKILSKDGCLGWKPPGTFWEQNINFFGCLVERETFSILSEDTGRPLQHTLTFASGLFHPPKERCSPTLILFQRATLSQPQQPCQEKKRWKARAWATLRFQVSYPSRRWKKKPGERGGARAPQTGWWIHASH